MNNQSVFIKIINGDLPSHKVYEDELTIAFLPLNPIALGHVLVVPKLQVDQFYDLPSAHYVALMNTVQKVATKMKEVIQPKRVGVQIIGLDVPHAHVHVIAFDTIEQFREVEDKDAPVNHEELEKIAQKLAF